MSNRIKTQLWLACALVLFASSCSQLQMTDSSDSPHYSWIVGHKLFVKEEVWAIGVTNDQNYAAPATHIKLVAGAGFSGPEVLFRERCCLNETLTITKVLTSSLPLISRVQYVVENESLKKFELDVKIDVWQSIDDGNLGLDTVFSLNRE